MLTVAMVAAATPAAAADPMGALLDKIQRAQARGYFERAAELAAPASRRDDLSAANRFLLAGLASESYGDAFLHGGAPRQPGRDPRYLCAQRTVLEEAAALAGDAQKQEVVNVALQTVAVRLGEVAASGRAVPCELAPVVAEPTVEPPTEPPAVASQEIAAAAEAAPRPEALPHPVDAGPARSRADQRRFQAGVGTLVAGLLLLAPMTAVLAHRSAGERELWALHAATAGGKAPGPETERATALRRRYQVTSASAAVLGATGAALAVTGVILLATGGRRSLVAAAPWGARDGGGLVLEGRF